MSVAGSSLGPPVPQIRIINSQNAGPPGFSKAPSSGPPGLGTKKSSAAITAANKASSSNPKWDFFKFAAKVQQTSGPLPGLTTSESAKLSQAPRIDGGAAGWKNASRYAFAGRSGAPLDAGQFQGSLQALFPNARISMGGVAGPGGLAGQLGGSGVLLDGSRPPAFAGFAPTNNIDKAFSPQGSPTSQFTAGSVDGGWGAPAGDKKAPPQAQALGAPPGFRM
jgi:hypothetical protein